MITGVAGEFAMLRQAVKDLEAKAVREVRDTILAATTAAMTRTPVWMGESVRNYRWGRDGSVPAGTIAAAGSGDPGPTNSMSIGEEPRRGANEAAAYADAVAIIDSKRLRDYVFTNTLPPAKWDAIDGGYAPGGPGQNARGPGGYMKIAQQTVRARGTWK